MEEDTTINNQEESDQSSEVDKVEEEEDANLPLHKSKRFQELRSEVGEVKTLLEQQREANEQLQSAVTKLANAKNETERNTIVDSLLKELDEKTDLTPSQLYRELDKIRKAEDAQIKQEEIVAEQRTAAETLDSFKEVQALEELSDNDVEELGAWMLEMLNKNGDKKIYSDPHRAFHQWDKIRKVNAEAKSSQEDKKSRSGVGSSSSATGEKVKYTFEQLLRMSPQEAKRKSQGI